LPPAEATRYVSSKGVTPRSFKVVVGKLWASAQFGRATLRCGPRGT